MPRMALLISAGAKAQLEGNNPARCPKTMTMRGNALVLVNDLLKRETGKVYDVSIKVVMHLVHLEWYWGEYESLWIHMNGVVEMVRAQGGLGEVRDDFLMQILVLTDYQLACSFDQDLVLLKPQAYKRNAQPLPVPYPEAFNSPLLDFSTPFVDIRQRWGLDSAAAEILDAVRDLTVTILSSSLTDSEISTQDILTKAHSIHARLLTSYQSPNSSSSTTETSLITTTVHFAALTYVTSISTLTPLSSLEPPAYLSSPTIQQMFHTTICAVSLSRWKQLPGIFLWILLVISPSCRNTRLEWFAKSKMTVTALLMSLEDFDIARSCLDSFWRVGAWVRNAVARQQ
ncbi:hypothetical protein B0O99DRAFT_687841 [Bisporella sp. PMI_857]|nr:hypothetical protein B0O99DRAFT_687841 [Bisporella sp. PMI_857]